MRKLLAVTLGISLSAVAPSAEQSLADVSRKAEEARKATPGQPAKVYTNLDVPAVAQVPPPLASETAAASTPDLPATAPATPSDKLSPDVTDKDEVYWRARMQPLREQLASARALADDTRRRAETLMRAADKCLAIGIVCADYTESLRLTDEHKALAAEVTRAERDVEALQEEARRAGVPPGWVRE